MAHSSDSEAEYVASPVPSRSSSKRKRSAQACVYCRGRKIRCDGQDNCKNCVAAGIVCEHSKVTPEENRIAREKKQAARIIRRARETGEPVTDAQLKHFAALEQAQAALYSPSLAPRRRHELQRRKNVKPLFGEAPPTPISPAMIRLPSAPVMRPTQSLPTPPRQAFDTSPGALDRAASRFDARTSSAREFWPRRIGGSSIPSPLDLSRATAVQMASALSADSVAQTAISPEVFSPMRRPLPYGHASSGSNSVDASDDEEPYSPPSSVDDGFRFEGPAPVFTHKIEPFDWSAARRHRRISYDYPPVGLGIGPLDELMPFGETWSYPPPLSAGLFGPGTVSLAHITPHA